MVARIMDWRIYFLIVMCFSRNVIGGKKYKIKLISAEKCPVLDGPIDKSEPVLYETTAKRLNKHTSVIRTNYAILRAVGPVLLNFKIYKLKSTRQLMFKIEKVDCNNPFSYQLIRVVNLKLDDECMAQPGNYSTNDINLQDFAWVAGKSSITPGKYLYELEFLTAKAGIALCNTIICDIQIK